MVRAGQPPSCPANWTAERCFLRRCYLNPVEPFQLEPRQGRVTQRRVVPLPIMRVVQESSPAAVLIGGLTVLVQVDLLLPKTR
jgi:hypothetical protein